MKETRCPPTGESYKGAGESVLPICSSLPRKKSASLGFLSNRLVLAGIAIELALAALIIYTPIGNAIFGCAPLGISVWLLLIPFALLLLAADETRKYVVRRGSHATECP